MSDFERAIVKAAESTRDRETEAAHGGPDAVSECDALVYADAISRAHQCCVFDGMVAIYASGPHRSGIPELHIMPNYFDEHFGDRADINYENLPAQSCIRKSVMHDGVKIFCMEKAVFAPVAA